MVTTWSRCRCSVSSTRHRLSRLFRTDISDARESPVKRLGFHARLPLSGRVFLPDIGYIVGRLDPFFAEAAGSTKISRYLGGTEDGCSDKDVVSGAEGAGFAGNANDFGGLTLWAGPGIFHFGPRLRGARLPRVSPEPVIETVRYMAPLQGALQDCRHSRGHHRLRACATADRLLALAMTAG
jgi:hypothetical protein